MPSLILAPAERIQEVALEILNDSEFGLIQELKSLSNAGFGEDQIRRMMGEDVYLASQDALRRVDLEFERLAQPPRRRVVRVIEYKPSRLERMIDDSEERERARLELDDE